ncbi:hypothetical protein QJS04_geneDACA024416 [Acorus gramineus]|uniref:Uncharacterized protein n=1 Tax=Acorus gramineus TaxID=55184 RepID=A0AAV9A2A3_ACOGR|nr:hypothetical protein QJS04_geneDACA024416 [Acorus gramineus]
MKHEQHHHHHYYYEVDSPFGLFWLLNGYEVDAPFGLFCRPIHAINSDRGKVVSGSNDQSVIVWDKQTFQILEELKGHDAQVSSVKMLSGERVLTASHDGGIRCVKNVTIHSAPILSINAGGHWLGIGAGDNSMSLFHRSQERLGSFSSTGSKSAGWQLYRTPQRTAAMVRCVASDLDRKRICSGGRNGLL